MEPIVLGVAAFILLICIVVVVAAIANAEGVDRSDEPIEIPGEDHYYSERPYY